MQTAVALQGKMAAPHLPHYQPLNSTHSLWQAADLGNQRPFPRSGKGQDMVCPRRAAVGKGGQTLQDLTIPSVIFGPAAPAPGSFLEM